MGIEKGSVASGRRNGRRTSKGGLTSALRDDADQRTGDVIRERARVDARTPLQSPRGPHGDVFAKRLASSSPQFAPSLDPTEKGLGFDICQSQAP